MRILHVVKTYHPYTRGGIEEVVCSLSNVFKKNGHYVEVLSCFDSLEGADYQEIYEEGVKVKFFSQDFSVMSSPFSYKLSKMFEGLSEGFDVVVFHTPWPFVDMLVNKLPKNTVSVVFHHSDSLSTKLWGAVERFYNFFHKKTLQKVDAIVCTSENYKNSSKYLASFLYKTNVIPLGIQVGVSKDALNFDSKFFDVNFQKGEYALFLGAFREYKGLSVLLKAASRSDVPLIIAGSGKTANKYQSIAKAYSNRIKFVGRVTDEEKDFLMEHCKFFVLPSINRAEAFGVVLLEASIHRKPMISTDLKTGTSYVNIDKLTGFVVPPGDSASLFNAMQELNDSALAIKMGQNAYLRVKSHFDINFVATSHLLLYKKLLLARMFYKPHF